MTNQNSHIGAPRIGLVAFPALMYGLLLNAVGFALYFFSVVLRFMTLFLDPHNHLLSLIERTIWYRAGLAKLDRCISGETALE